MGWGAHLLPSPSSSIFFFFILFTHGQKMSRGLLQWSAWGVEGAPAPTLDLPLFQLGTDLAVPPPPLPPARNSIEDEGRRGREERKEGGGNEPLRSCALDLTSYESQAKWFDSGISNPLKNHGVIILLYEFLAKK